MLTMSDSKRKSLAKYLKLIARILGFVFGFLVFSFALLSGAESYGNDFWAVVKNSPNAFPWLIFLVLMGLSGRWTGIAGTLITLIGFFMLYFFHIFDRFMWPTFIIVAIVLLCGFLLVISSLLSRSITKTT